MDRFLIVLIGFMTSHPETIATKSAILKLGHITVRDTSTFWGTPPFETQIPASMLNMPPRQIWHKLVFWCTSKQTKHVWVWYILYNYVEECTISMFQSLEFQNHDLDACYGSVSTQRVAAILRMNTIVSIVFETITMPPTPPTLPRMWGGGGGEG